MRAEQIAQSGPSAMDTTPHRPDRHIESVGDLGIGHPHHVAEHQRCPEVIGQRLERTLDLDGKIDRGQSLIGGRGSGQDPFGIVGERLHRAPFATPNLIEEHIGRD